MTELDRLPPDQRAVLSLVLERGKSYGEVADMLAIPESAVRDRAHAALDALANDSPRSEEQRSAAAERAGTAGRSRLRAPARSDGERASERVSEHASERPPRERDPRARRTAASSRRAGALLLGAILAVIVLVVILISGGSGKSSSHTPSTTSNTASSTTASAPKATLDKTITLSAAEPTLKANGVVYVLSEGTRRAFYVAAQGLPPSSGFFYAVWLYNSPSSAAPLGRAPTVSSNGRMEGGGPLPSNAGNYHQLIITRETSTHPSTPGPTVMSGPFALH